MVPSEKLYQNASPNLSFSIPIFPLYAVFSLHLSFGNYTIFILSYLFFNVLSQPFFFMFITYHHFLFFFISQFLLSVCLSCIAWGINSTCLRNGVAEIVKACVLFIGRRGGSTLNSWLRCVDLDCFQCLKNFCSEFLNIG